MDMFLSLKEKKIIEPPELIFCGERSVCNSVALEMVVQSIPSFKSGLAYSVLYDLLKLFGWTRLLYELPSDQDTVGVLQNQKCHFAVPRCVSQQTSAFLEGFPNRPFFVTILRDQAYLDHILRGNFDYHSHRNSDPVTHFSAINDFASKHQLNCFRMSAVSNYKLESHFKSVIDYSTKYRNESLDIGLVNECLFFSNSGSGFHSVPKVLRKPMVMVNQVHLNFFGLEALLQIPKKHWYIDEHRFLSFKEIVGSELGYILNANKLKERNIELVENTPEEIFDAHEECYQRLMGNFDSDPEMVNLNEEFKKYYLTDTVTPKFKAPFGEKFMRQNIELFR